MDQQSALVDQRSPDTQWEPWAPEPNGVYDLDHTGYRFEHHPDILDAVRRDIGHNVSNYGRDRSTRFKTHVAEYVGVSEDRLVITHGGEDGLIKLFLYLRTRGSRLVFPDVAWRRYLKMFGGLGYQTHEFEVGFDDSGFGFDTKRLKSELDSTAGTVVLLPSPNNPTGHVTPLDEILALVWSYPQHFFVIDAVYMPLTDPIFSALSNEENVWVVGSFSKVYGMPGLRAGFVVGTAPEALDPYLGIGPTAISVCEAAMRNEDFYEKNRNFMYETSRGLAQIDDEHYRFYPSRAPFVLLRTSLDLTAADYARIEADTKVHPRYYPLRGKMFMRFTLGPDAIVAKIREYAKAAAL
jgi:threonine-phosphate decarboxylase